MPKQVHSGTEKKKKTNKENLNKINLEQEKEEFYEIMNKIKGKLSGLGSN